MSRFWTTFIRNLGLLALLTVGGLLTACGVFHRQPPLPTPVVMDEPPASWATPTTTPIPAAWVVVLPADAPPEAQAWAEQSRPWVQAMGLRWATVPDLAAADAQAPVAALIAMPPVPWTDAQGWALAHAQTRVLAWVTEPGAAPDPDKIPPNLTLMLSEPLSWEQRFFLAGYSTVLTTQHWRAGLLYTSPPGYGALELAADFNRGATYWCGPCVPAHPPMVAYPLAVEVPPGVEDAASWQEAARTLLNQAPMEAIYVRGPAPAETLDFLKQHDVVVIWDGSSQSKADVSMYFDPWTILDKSWAEAWLDEEEEPLVYARWRVEVSSPTALSPGRVRLIEEMVQLLESGRVAVQVPGGP